MPTESIADRVLRAELRVATSISRVRANLAGRAHSALYGRIIPIYKAQIFRLRRIADAYSRRGGGWIGLRIVGNVMHDLLDQLEGVQPAQAISLPATAPAAIASESFWTFGRRRRSAQMQIGDGR